MTAAERALRAVLATKDRLRGGVSGEYAFGPIPMTVHADHVTLLDSVGAHALGDHDRASWRPLDVTLCTSTSIARSELPAPLRPGPWPGPVLLFHAGPLTALVGDGMLWVVDRESATALRWTEGSEDIPIWEALRPLRFVLRWWAAEHDAALLHAAAVAIDGHAALLVGESGAGKSTTAFACMSSELVVLGDDYCLVEAPKGSGQITVHATYRLGNLTDASLALLPHLRERVIGSGLRGKSVIALEPLSLGQGAASVHSICAVIQAPGESTRLMADSAVGSVRSLGPSTLSQIPGSLKQTWAVVTSVSRRRPAYQLRVGDLRDAPTVLSELLSRDSR